MSLRVPDAEFISTIVSSVPTLGNVGPTERNNYSHQRDRGLISKGRGQIPVSIQRQRQAPKRRRRAHRLNKADRGPQKIDSDGPRWSQSQVWAQRDSAADGTEEAQSGCWQGRVRRGSQAVAWPGSVIPGGRRVDHTAAAAAAAAELPERCPIPRGSAERGLLGNLGIPRTAVSS